MTTPTELIELARPPTTKSLALLNDSTSVVESPIREACRAWLLKSPSLDTRSNYERDLSQFLIFAGFAANDVEKLAAIRPHQVAAWRDQLAKAELTNSSIRRKLTVLRSLFSYLQTYGYVGANPAHSDFVAAPAAPRDGKTVGLTPEDCRRLLTHLSLAPSSRETYGTAGLISRFRSNCRTAHYFAVLAYTGCRVGELTRLKVGSYKTTGVHKILEIHGKGGKERRVPLHPEAAERIEAWLDIAGVRDDSAGAMFRPLLTAHERRHRTEKGFVEPRRLARRVPSR